jgi:hypothetical protein
MPEEEKRDNTWGIPSFFWIYEYLFLKGVEYGRNLMVNKDDKASVLIEIIELERSWIDVQKDSRPGCAFDSAVDGGAAAVQFCPGE